MAKVKISQHLALMVESLRAKGVDGYRLLELAAEGNPERLAQAGQGSFDSGEWAGFAATDPELLRQAVLDGYEIKFNTINGIRSLLRIKYGMEAERVSVVEHDYIRGIALRTGELAWLRSVLSGAWSVRVLHTQGGVHEAQIVFKK